jgi:Skp family chaperone for outer membrane proteins
MSARSSPRVVRITHALLVAGVVLTLAGCAPRVGVVDHKRILNESVLALTFQKQLDDREKTMVTDLRLLTGQLSREDLEARRQAYVRELAGLRGELESRLNDRIRTAVGEEARRRRLRIVLVKEVTRLGGIDITDAVLDRLK